MIRVLIGLVVSILLVSCWTNPREDKHEGVSSAVDSNIKRSQLERALIDSIAHSWGWGDEVLLGGVRYSLVKNSDELNTLDSTVFLNVRVDLINGNPCYTLDTLPVKVGKYAGMQALDELVKIMGANDSVVALVPSDFGHGLAGMPGVVPPAAMLKISAYQLPHPEAQ